MNTPLLSLKGIGKIYVSESNVTVGIRGVDLSFNRGEFVAVTGKSGSGKSTLLKVISGQMDVDSGEVFSQPAIKVVYMDQESNLSGFKTLKEYICSGLSKEDAHAEYKADILIDKLDINALQEVETASGGEKKKASLAHALIQEPDILLLDEPTNHLDIVTIEKLEDISRFHSYHKDTYLHPFGTENRDQVYGGMKERAKTAIRRIGMYLDGRIDALEELEETRLDYNGGPLVTIVPKLYY